MILTLTTVFLLVAALAWVVHGRVRLQLEQKRNSRMVTNHYSKVVFDPDGPSGKLLYKGDLERLSLDLQKIGTVKNQDPRVTTLWELTCDVESHLALIDQYHPEHLLKMPELSSERFRILPKPGDILYLMMDRDFVTWCADVCEFEKIEIARMSRMIENGPQVIATRVASHMSLLWDSFNVCTILTDANEEVEGFILGDTLSTVSVTCQEICGDEPIALNLDLFTSDSFQGVSGRLIRYQDRKITEELLGQELPEEAVKSDLSRQISQQASAMFR